jgi:hypothetical protein
MSRRLHRCETCPHYEPDGAAPRQTPPPYGKCHARPPVPVATRMNDGPPRAHFPQVREDEWCADHPGVTR